MQYLVEVVGLREVQNVVAQDNLRLIALTDEPSGQRIVVQFGDLKIANPLPELGLSRPVLRPVPTNDAGGSLSFLVFWLGLF